MAIPSSIFISYRRNASAFIARAIFMDLRHHDFDVFMDVESIDNGQFEMIILDQIAARAHFLVILTHGTLEGCQDPSDWLRREIEQAIAWQRNIVPILVNDFRFDARTLSYLAGPLLDLPRYNALTLSHDYFDEAMERLRLRFLKQQPQGDVKPTPRQHEPVVQQIIEHIASQPIPTKQELLTEESLNHPGTTAITFPHVHNSAEPGEVTQVVSLTDTPQDRQTARDGGGRDSVPDSILTMSQKALENLAAPSEQTATRRHRVEDEQQQRAYGESPQRQAAREHGQREPQIQSDHAAEEFTRHRHSQSDRTLPLSPPPQMRFWIKGSMAALAVVFAAVFLLIHALRTTQPPQRSVSLPSLSSQPSLLQNTAEKNVDASEKSRPTTSQDAGPDATQIRQLQERLKTEGWYIGPIDGDFSILTRAALRRYQEAHNLPETGTLDAATQQAISTQSDKLLQKTFSTTDSERNKSTPSETLKERAPDAAQIRQLQERLKTEGWYIGPIDGDFSILTRAALRRYQEAHNLPETGTLDAATQQAISTVTKERKKPKLNQR